MGRPYGEIYTCCECACDRYIYIYIGIKVHNVEMALIIQLLNNLGAQWFQKVFI